VPTFKFIFPAERFSPSGFKPFVAFYKIISVTDRPTLSCFAVGFQLLLLLAAWLRAICHYTAKYNSSNMWTFLLSAAIFVIC